MVGLAEGMKIKYMSVVISATEKTEQSKGLWIS